MSKEKEIIEIYKWKRSDKYVDAPTNSIRELGDKILGKLDTAISFMYLFRRFGTPQETNQDEYKILYSYTLKYKDMLFSIHASYHEFVYFNAWMPELIRDKRVKEYRKATKQLALDSFKKGIYYMPYSISGGLNHFPKSLKDKLNILYDKKAQEYFSEEDYKFLCEYKFSDELFANETFYDKIEPFNEELCKQFRASLNKEQLKMFEWETISDYPELEKQCQEFFNELLRGYYIRDVPINIRGYESETNNITEFEYQEED